jgi:hypothetical protein
VSLAARECSVERLPSSLKVGQAHIDEQRQINQVFDSRIDAFTVRQGIGMEFLGELLLTRKCGSANGRNTRKVQNTLPG